MLRRLLSVVCNNISSISINSMRHNSLNQTGIPGPYSSIPVKKLTRNNWPRPKETKKIGTHGYEKRMQTLHGRKIIMRRILAGRYFLSH